MEALAMPELPDQPATGGELLWLIHLMLAGWPAALAAAGHQAAGAHRAGEF